MGREEVRAAIGEPNATENAWNYPSDAVSITFTKDGTVNAVFGGTGSPSPESSSVGSYALRFKARTREGIGITSSRSEVLAALGTPWTDRKDEFGAEYLWYRDSGLHISLWHDQVYNIAILRPAP
jgi:hypothetical protein